MCLDNVSADMRNDAIEKQSLSELEKRNLYNLPERPQTWSPLQLNLTQRGHPTRAAAGTGVMARLMNVKGSWLLLFCSPQSLKSKNKKMQGIVV